MHVATNEPPYDRRTHRLSGQYTTAPSGAAARTERRCAPMHGTKRRNFGMTPALLPHPTPPGTASGGGEGLPIGPAPGPANRTGPPPSTM